MNSETPEPLLSLEETSALLDAMRSGSEGDVAVDELDLASPERPLRHALATADACARLIGQAVDKLLLRTTGHPSSTEELPAEITPYKMVRGGIPHGSAVVRLSAPDGSVGLLILGPMLVAFILDRRMGAPLTPDSSITPRTELSALDRRLLAPVSNAVAEEFSKLWCADAAGLQTSEVLAQGADLPALAQFEPMLQITLRVVPAGQAGDQVIFALSSGLVVLAKGTRAELPRALRPRAADRQKLEIAINQANVEAIAVLGETRSTIRDVLALRVGDIVRLEGSPTQPIDVRSGDKIVLRGTPVVRHGNLAIHVSQLGAIQP
jgi:flagellar motor switch protein FliM